MVIRNRCPAWNSCTIAGSVTATGCAWSIDAGSPVSRTGATSPSGSVSPFFGSTSYSLTNSTACPVGEAARMRTVGAPTTSTVDGSGAERKSACCPGTSTTRPLTNDATPPPSPGSDVIAAGLPPGGLAIGRSAPRTSTVLVAPPATPG